LYYIVNKAIRKSSVQMKALQNLKFTLMLTLLKVRLATFPMRDLLAVAHILAGCVVHSETYFYWKFFKADVRIRWTWSAVP
jgi:hypothetical protein